MKLFNVVDYGAVGDGKTDNAETIQKAIDDCSAYKNGTVFFPSGPFDLKSNIKFQVDNNCAIIANPDETVYKKSAFRENLGEGTIWIGGENAENIEIFGNKPFF